MSLSVKTVMQRYQSFNNKTVKILTSQATIHRDSSPKHSL